MNICLITCYNQPDYIRTKTLHAGLDAIDGVTITQVKNSNTGLLRYPEVLLKTIRARLVDKPDVYILTFRGYEMLLPIRLISIGRPFIYDEFINPIEWVVRERRQVEAKQSASRAYTKIISIFSRFVVYIVASRLFKHAYRLLVSTTSLVFADTDSHADVSAKITGLARSRYVGIHVATDEVVFNKQARAEIKNKQFTVFYYGNMLPLHGLSFVVEAAAAMKNDQVRFIIIGGSSNTAKQVASAVKDGANIEYQAWVDFDTLPEYMRTADICLAGPFGNTFQSQYVITGKAYQYMAMGRPTLIGRNKESAVFTNKKNILIVPQADSGALAERIRWAMNHGEELKAIGEEGKKLYEQEFSIHVISKRLEDALAKL